MIKNLLKSLKGSNHSIPMQLSKIEQQYFVSVLEKATNYLEFGSGGSTFLAITSPSIKQIVSVESASSWIEYMKTFDTIDNALEDKLIFEYVDIGATGEWGFPINDEKKDFFPNYSHMVFDKYRNNYDLVFIDGRFRVACALQTILNCDNETNIIMHDYNNRPQYHCILEFLNIIYTMDTMALFKQKQNIDKKRVFEMYEKYKFISE